MFYGDLFDEQNNVSHEVDSFTFPRKKELEKVADDLLYKEGDLLVTMDEIDKQVTASLPEIYREVVDARLEKQRNVAEIAAAHGIPAEIAESAGVQQGDDEEKITEKLYLRQAERLSEENFEIKKIYESLVALNPASDGYQEELLDKTSELLSRIPQQNKEELSRYVIRREMVAKIIGLILSQSLEYQRAPRAPKERRDKEGLVHDLIFKRRSDTGSGLNDLWVLDEEFLHFSGYSDMPLNRIELPGGGMLLGVSDAEMLELGLKVDRRPDIFLYPEEGKCILVELKAPDVDLADHLNQLTKYCNLIANYSNIKVDRFFCYLIGENLNMGDLPGEFVRTVNDDWVKVDQPVRSQRSGHEDRIIAHARIEVLLLSSIALRAHRRNRSFAERLGIRQA